MTNVDFNGRTNTFQYDVVNRLTQKTPAPAFNQSPITFTYYPTGVRSNMVDGFGTTTALAPIWWTVEWVHES